MIKSKAVDLARGMSEDLVTPIYATEQKDGDWIISNTLEIENRDWSLQIIEFRNGMGMEI